MKMKNKTINNMKAKLIFDLNDEDDIMSHMRCAKSLDMALLIFSFPGKLRDLVDRSEDGKYIDEELVFQAWQECLDDYKIDINDLVR